MECTDLQLGYLVNTFNPVNLTSALDQKVHSGPGVVAHAFNPSTREAEAGGFLSSRTARATQRNPVSKETKRKKKKKSSLRLGREHNG